MQPQDFLKNLNPFTVGIVREIVNTGNYRIAVEVPGLFTRVEADPLVDYEPPRVGESCILINLDRILNSTFVYIRIRNHDNTFVGTRVGDTAISQTEDGVTTQVGGDSVTSVSSDSIQTRVGNNSIGVSSSGSTMSSGASSNVTVSSGATGGVSMKKGLTTVSATDGGFDAAKGPISQSLISKLPIIMNQAAAAVQPIPKVGPMLSAAITTAQAPIILKLQTLLYPLPSLPKAPQLPKLPSPPQIPTLPDLPDAPRIPDLPRLPNLPVDSLPVPSVGLPSTSSSNLLNKMDFEDLTRVQLVARKVAFSFALIVEGEDPNVDFNTTNFGAATLECPPLDNSIYDSGGGLYRINIRLIDGLLLANLVNDDNTDSSFITFMGLTGNRLTKLDSVDPDLTPSEIAVLEFRLTANTSTTECRTGRFTITHTGSSDPFTFSVNQVPNSI